MPRNKQNKTFARVKLDVALSLTVPIPNRPTKADIKNAVLEMLRSITDKKDLLKCVVPDCYRQIDATIHVPKQPEANVNMDTIFTLKGLTLLDIFEEVVPDSELDFQ